MKTMNKLTLLALTALTMSTAVSAYDKYDTNGDGIATDTEVYYYLMDEYAIADKALNKAWKEMKGTVSKNRYKAMLKKQRTWIKFKEAECAIPELSGSMDMVASAGCYKDMTEKRVDIIRNNTY